MQIPRERISWIEPFEPPERAYDVVLYLGCNILRTPDIAAEVTWDGREPPFAITHCTTFFAERARCDEMPLVRKVPRRVALHTLVGRDGHAAGRQKYTWAATSPTSWPKREPRWLTWSV